MKTSYGKLSLLAFLILIAVLLLAPMRAGVEDSMVLNPDVLKISVGDSYVIKCAIASDDARQRISFVSADPRVAAIRADGTVRAISSGETVITASASGGASAAMRVIVAGTPMRTLKLNTNELHIEKGEISGLNATYNTDASDARLQWTSSDEGVARVSANGHVLGVSGGEADISVLSSNGLMDTARVYVDVRSTAVRIAPRDLVLGVGAEVELDISCLPVDSTDSVRRWSSSDPSVAYVDESNILHAVGMGNVFISVLTADGLTTGMEVRVERSAAEIHLEPAQATVERGDALALRLIQLTAVGDPHDYQHMVTWSSSNPSVASVDESGRVEARSAGTARITVVTDGMTAACDLNVAVSVKEIALDRTEVYLLKEDTAKPIQLKYSITPADPDDPTVTFASNNEQVASVDQNGLVTMTGGYGTAIITASNVSGARATFTVNVVTELPGSEPEAADARDSFGAIEQPESEIQSEAAEAVPTVQPQATPTVAPDDDVVFGGTAAGFVSHQSNAADTGDYEGENIY